MYKFISITIGLLLIIVIVYFIADKVNNKKVTPNKVILSLESEENLSDWKITLSSPSLNEEIKKWVFDLNIQYIGSTKITNIEYNIGKSSGTANLLEPSKSSFGTTENLVPEHGNDLIFNIKWDETKGKSIKGKAVYKIIRE